MNRKRRHSFSPTEADLVLENRIYRLGKIANAMPNRWLRRKIRRKQRELIRKRDPRMTQLARSLGRFSMGDF